MAKYKVVKPIKLGSPDYLGRGDITRHEPGDVIDVDDEMAARLGFRIQPHAEAKGKTESKQAAPKQSTQPADTKPDD